MPSYPIVSSQDGLRLTVNQLMKTPTIIPKRVINSLDQAFLTNAILRKGNDAPSGIVMFWESTPLFAAATIGVVDEFGEIPTISGTMGTPRSVRTVKRAAAIKVSWEMKSRNDVDSINTQIAQVRNTMIMAWEDAFFGALVANTTVPTVAATTTWDSASSKIRKDINNARYQIKNSAADAGGTQKFGFIPDTLVISTETELDFLNSDEISKPYVGNLASENLLYTGKLPSKFLGLDVVTSWRMDVYKPNAALLCERNTLGFISDERSLRATPMYSERGSDATGGSNETWRTDISRISAVGIDQPLAACWISGAHT